MKKKFPVKEKKFFLKPEFKSLQEEWYAKLADEGFVDTETIRDIRTNSVNQQLFRVNDQWAVYHEKCNQYILSGKIENALDLYIFEQHSNGRSNREIESELKHSSLKPISRMTIARRLAKLLEDAQIEPIVFKI